mmetsp:Transcript_112901/g.324494  ORF Transcript_112901/g.324494 Transcript_112901/m.324494 type:complete len:319 (+) Transcript_112901:596-1552(+)
MHKKSPAAAERGLRLHALVRRARQLGKASHAEGQLHSTIERQGGTEDRENHKDDPRQLQPAHQGARAGGLARIDPANGGLADLPPPPAHPRARHAAPRPKNQAEGAKEERDVRLRHTVCGDLSGFAHAELQHAHLYGQLETVGEQPLHTCEVHALQEQMLDVVQIGRELALVHVVILLLRPHLRIVEISRSDQLRAVASRESDESRAVVLLCSQKCGVHCHIAGSDVFIGDLVVDLGTQRDGVQQHIDNLEKDRPPCQVDQCGQRRRPVGEHRAMVGLNPSFPFHVVVLLHTCLRLQEYSQECAVRRHVAGGEDRLEH